MQSPSSEPRSQSMTWASRVPAGMEVLLDVGGPAVLVLEPCRPDCHTEASLGGPICLPLPCLRPPPRPPPASFWGGFSPERVTSSE
eukprot:355359-Chlamydomonas_euryale.AAC.16